MGKALKVNRSSEPQLCTAVTFYNASSSSLIKPVGHIWADLIGGSITNSGSRGMAGNDVRVTGFYMNPDGTIGLDVMNISYDSKNSTTISYNETITAEGYIDSHIFCYTPPRTVSSAHLYFKK